MRYIDFTEVIFFDRGDAKILRVRIFKSRVLVLVDADQKEYIKFMREDRYEGRRKYIMFHVNLTCKIWLEY